LRIVPRFTPTDTMHAIRLLAPTGPRALSYEVIETPEPGEGEALVRVHAAAITRDELDWPVDRLPATPSYEFSGIVAALGPGVTQPSIGDEVYALAGFDRDGAAADFVLVPSSLLAPRPASLDHTQSAALPLAALSAWQGLFDHGRLEKGRRVLITGASGGVGHLATQLARQRGAYVTGTASTEKMDFVKTLGAHEVIDHSETRLEEAIEQVDLVFDTVGGDLLRRSPAVMRSGGKIVSIAEDPPKLAAESGIDSVYFVVEPNRNQLIQVADLVDRGELKPAVDSTFPLAEARAAFARSMDRATCGKVILRVADE
jgi:NADPH:quinone reductase-like Zn-dependent oxidoreductase